MNRFSAIMLPVLLIVLTFVSTARSADLKPLDPPIILPRPQPVGVIGQTTVFNLTPAQVLVAQTDDPTEIAGVQVFNYFFTIQLFVGLVAAWIRILISIVKSEVL